VNLLVIAERVRGVKFGILPTDVVDVMLLASLQLNAIFFTIGRDIVSPVRLPAVLGHCPGRVAIAAVVANSTKHPAKFCVGLLLVLGVSAIECRQT